METAKLIILLCCAYYSMASHSHTIPVDEYETKLTVLGQHVEIPETPVKVIKITRTVAVKVPVPYPVKVVEKVPYPVHISKPYPVPVPHIVQVPHHVPAPSHKVADSGDGSYQGGHHDYNVQENEPVEPLSHTHFDGGNGGYGASADEHASEGQGNSFEGHPNAYYGYQPGSDDHGSSETQSYDDAIREYFDRHNAGGAGHQYH